MDSRQNMGGHLVWEEHLTSLCCLIIEEGDILSGFIQSGCSVFPRMSPYDFNPVTAAPEVPTAVE